MKLFLCVALGIVSLGLVIALFVMKQDDTAQHETDSGAIADYSNRLDTAHSQIASLVGTWLAVSNNLDTCQSAWEAVSNQLVTANLAIADDTEQITNLNRQVAAKAEVDASNQTLNRHVLELTNQMDRLALQLALTQTNLAQTNQALVQLGQDYVLLENRFRIDVGERTVAERKFGNLPVLKAQMKLLKKHPAAQVSDLGIYAGLDVEVRSNGTFHVIAPN
jgi:hypothetical protein